MVLNPQFSGSKKLAWFTCKLFICCTLTFSAGRLYWVVTNWKYIQDFEQLCSYALLSLTIIGWEALEVFENHTKEFAFSITHRFPIVRTAVVKEIHYYLINLCSSFNLLLLMLS